MDLLRLPQRCFRHSKAGTQKQVPNAFPIQCDVHSKTHCYRFIHSFKKHLLSTYYDINCNQESRFLLSWNPKQVRPTGWQKCSREDQGDRDGSKGDLREGGGQVRRGFHTQWTWTGVWKNVGNHWELRVTAPWVTFLLVLVYFLILLQWACVTLLFFCSLQNNSIQAPSCPRPFLATCGSSPSPGILGFLSAAVLPGNHPCPSASFLASPYPSSLTLYSCTPPGLGCSLRVLLQSTLLQSTIPPPNSLLADHPWVLQQAFYLPPKTPAVWLPCSLLLHPPAHQPFQPHFLVSLCLRSQMWRGLSAKETLPCGEEEVPLLCPQRRWESQLLPGNWPTPWAGCLPTPLSRG